MKTINDVLMLINQAIMNNQEKFGTLTCSHWFIDYSGHVNKMHVRYYKLGWSKEQCENGARDECEIYLNNEEQVQELYWFVKSRV